MRRRRSVTDLPALAAAVRRGEHRAVARAISLIEAAAPERDRLMELLAAEGEGSWVIGVTGPPGAGKSTLIGRLIVEIRKRGEKVAVLAVDPTSPFSGGALLGDRVRMNLHGTDPEVFIRSMASAGHVGGLSPAAVETVTVLQAAGYNNLIVESVGVGQSEVGILTLADLVAVVLQPGSGDEIQALKAGVMEIADLFVINKADIAGVEALERSLRDIVEGSNRSTLRPGIRRTVATSGVGVGELYAAFAERFERLSANGELRDRREARLVGAFEEMAVDLFREWLRRRGLTDPRGGVPFGMLREELMRLLNGLDEELADDEKAEDDGKGGEAT